MGRNAHFSYTADGTTYSQGLYVESMQQSFDLSGSKAQTRLHQQFFPRGYAPGNLSMTARAVNQDEYQRFAKFVREHQKTMVNTPGNVTFSSLAINSVGYKRLMRIFIDGEGVDYRGWIPSFSMRKEGFMVPSPTFDIDFFVAFDAHSLPIFASRQVVKLWWQQTAPKPFQAAGTKVSKQPQTTAQQPGFDIIDAITTSDPTGNSAQTSGLFKIGG